MRPAIPLLLCSALALAACDPAPEGVLLQDGEALVFVGATVWTDAAGAVQWEEGDPDADEAEWLARNGYTYDRTDFEDVDTSLVLRGTFRGRPAVLTVAPTYYRRATE